VPTESLPLALQRVFYHLQTSDQPVGEQFWWIVLVAYALANIYLIQKEQAN
jgi:hypothetical protein